MENVLTRLRNIRDEEGVLLDPKGTREHKLLKRRSIILQTCEYGRKEDTYGYRQAQTEGL